MWPGFLAAAVLTGLPWPNILADSAADRFLKRYDRIARQRPSLVIEAEVSEADDGFTTTRVATITAVRPATLRMDLSKPDKTARETTVLTDREWRAYDARHGTAAGGPTNPGKSIPGFTDWPSTLERLGAWVLFGYSRSAEETFQLRITKTTEWYVHVQGKPRDPKNEVRLMEVVFNRKQMTPARVWFQYANGTQVTWLVKEARVDKRLTAAKAIDDLPPVDPK
jgi:hypothetical protein